MLSKHASALIGTLLYPMFGWALPGQDQAWRLFNIQKPALSERWLQVFTLHLCPWCHPAWDRFHTSRIVMLSSRDWKSHITQPSYTRPQKNRNHHFKIFFGLDRSANRHSWRDMGEFWIEFSSNVRVMHRLDWLQVCLKSLRSLWIRPIAVSPSSLQPHQPGGLSAAGRQSVGAGLVTLLWDRGLTTAVSLHCRMSPSYWPESQSCPCLERDTCLARTS